jgi:hypothetical protein
MSRYIDGLRAGWPGFDARNISVLGSVQSAVGTGSDIYPKVRAATA